MHLTLRPIALAGILALCAPLLASAQSGEAGGASPVASPLPVPPARTVVTRHSTRVGGRVIQYTATAGTILLTNAKDQPSASVFYVAYSADGLGLKAARPITFAYNGGPGGSSALLHLGAFGPRTVVTANATTTRPAPYEMVDNQDSLLDTTDLVFVDAVGTGFSRIVGHGTPKEFYGVDQDGRAFEQFIRRYISANGRWNSPKYLAGESYGTTRSAVLARMLQGDGIALNGVILLSSVLNFGALWGTRSDDLPYWLFVPTYAAVAAYHKKLSPAPSDVPAFLQSARKFAAGPYEQALEKGDAITPSERQAIAQQLHAFTGLPVDYILRSRLRIEPGRFQKALLGSDEETVGRYDGRFSAFDLDPIDPDAETDPAADAIFSAFTTSFNRYVRDELNYQTDEEYRFLTGIGENWAWQRGDGTSAVALNVSEDLKIAMTVNPYLRVFSGNGLYDLATPFFGTEYTLGHLGLAAPLQSHISYGYYDAGHMIYLNPAAHAALKRDLSAFYR